MSTTKHDLDAATERRIEESLERRQQTLTRREWLGTLLFSGGFLAAGLALAVLATPARELSLPVAIAFVAAYALAGRIEFTSGAGYAIPTQLVFVPMLLLLPTPYVPLLVAAANLTASTADAVRGDVAPSRLLLSPADAAFALGPAIVLVLGGGQLPAWDHVPLYALALAAQLLVEFAAYTARARLFHGLGPSEVLSELRLAHRVDVLLSPVGLLAAIAAADAPAAALLVTALFPLLIGFDASARAGSSTASSSAAPTGAPRCCCATCSRRTTSTRATTPRTSSSCRCGSGRRWASTRTRCARPRWARCCTTSARSRCPTRSSTSRARSTTRSGRS
jgi:hypothetical protein